MRVDPVLALVVDIGLKAHLRPRTTASYGTGARSYVLFMESRGLQPWPVTPVEYCGWLHTLPPGVQVPSMKVYKAGVRDASILEGHGWPMEGNEYVRRTMRFLERKYPSKSKGQKFPITVGVLYRILPLLSGWPDMSCMSAEDRVFAAASIIGLSGFLRGGEFLESKQSDRAVLLAMDVCLRVIGDRDAVVVMVRQPKTRPWLSTVAVPCFGNVFNDAFCPVRLWREYWSRCPEFGTKGASSPAFVLMGKPLSRDYMVKRTTSLLSAANVSFVDQKGDQMLVKAASWRSGAVCSAVQAGVPAQDIQSLGRWTSEAWKNYLLQAPLNLQDGACSMWADTSLNMVPATSGLLVAEFDVSGFFAPRIACDINSMLSKLGIDVNDPTPK